MVVDCVRSSGVCFQFPVVALICDGVFGAGVCFQFPVVALICDGVFGADVRFTLLVTFVVEGVAVFSDDKGSMSFEFPVVALILGGGERMNACDCPADIGFSFISV